MCGFFTIWCRLAELNCPLILTMDVYYHYTKAAALIYCNRNDLIINTFLNF